MNRAELLKVAKPILFNTEMVQAILDGRKTVTRRVIKPKYRDSIFEMDQGILYETEPYTLPVDLGNGLKEFKVRQFVECKAPYKVGDILYVRETHRYASVGEVDYEGECLWQKDVIEYKATQQEFEQKYGDCIGEYYKWRPSIHMPKEAARIFLKVTDVRVERLQDIAILQAISEGAMHNPPAFPRAIMRDCYNQNLPYAVASFAVIWDKTVKKQDLDKYGWEANPFVWVTEFERVKVDG